MPGTGTAIDVEALERWARDFAEWERELRTVERTPRAERPGGLSQVPGFARALSGALALAYSAEIEADFARTAGRELLLVMSAQADELTDPIVQAALRELGQARVALARVIGNAARFLADVVERMQHPERILEAQLADLAYSVALIQSWRIGHREDIHLPLRGAMADQLGAATAVGQATADLGVETVRAIREVVDVRFPDLRDDMRARVQRVADNLRETREQLDADLAQVARVAARELAEVVRWLRREVIPGLEHDLVVEVEARTAGDRALQRGLAAEAEVRTDTDAALMAQLAPLVAWASAFGVQTTTKVNKMEPTFDQLLGAGPDWLGVLALPPNLLALVTTITSRVAGSVPSTLVGIEQGAARALGVL